MHCQTCCSKVIIAEAISSQVVLQGRSIKARRMSPSNGLALIATQLVAIALFGNSIRPVYDLLKSIL